MRPRILVVDDSPVCLSVLRGLLERRGYEVMTASNGLTAMSIAAWHDIDCVILDWDMPAYKGTDVESFFVQRNIPTFYYSAYDCEDLKTKTRLPVLSKMIRDYDNLYGMIEGMLATCKKHALA